MKKRILSALLACALMLTLTACGCKHETWLDADCVTPKTCAECGETEGEALGHDWAEADCLTAKTCARCGETEGEALGHDMMDATCVDPSTCSRCGETEGEALGHIWLDATTEAPETCEICGETHGERIITDRRFTTEANKHLFGTWQAPWEVDGELLGQELAPYVDTVPVTYEFTFYPDGTLSLKVLPADEAVIVNVMCEYTVDVMYQQFAAMGVDKAAANNAMRAQYGMTVEEYVAAEIAKMDMSELFSSFSVEYVYYVDGDQMYLGFDWDEMEGKTYSWEGDTLLMPVDGYEDVAFTRVVEEE